MEQNALTQLTELAQQQAEMCKVFSSSRRVLIYWLLADSEMSVGEISEAVGASMQNTSQHLRLMKDKGVLKSHREGQTIYYRIANEDLITSCPVLLPLSLSEDESPEM